MKKITFLMLSLLTTCLVFGQDLVITGVYDGALAGGTPKTIELYAINDIADLSSYAIGSANNGGGTDGIELQLTGAASAGDYLYVASEATQFEAFFGFAPTFTSSAASNNGDDAIELFGSVTGNDTDGFTGTVIDTFGEIDVDGSGQAWEYTDGWAYRVDGTGPDGATFTLANFTYSGPNANDDDTTTQADATNPWPIGSYSTEASSEPSLTITSPTTDQVFASGTTSVDIEFSTMNFDLSGGNVVEYIVNGAAPETATSSPITIATTDGTDYTVTLELKDDSGSLDPQVLGTATFSIGSSSTIASIADLRAGDEDVEYTLTNEVILTFQKTERNQKWIQDDTAAILIDDSPGVITTTYAIGDGITGITGTLSSFNGLLQFRPSVDPGAATSTGNEITVQEVTTEELNDNGEAYESEIVKIVDATISDAGTAWVDDTNYTLTTDDGEFLLRTTLEDFDTDYIGTTIPSGDTDITGFITQFDNNDDDVEEGYQITPRFLADIEADDTATCALTLGTTTFECDATTSGDDTVTVTIPYTNGGGDTFTITASSGTVAGDDPSTVAEGNILVTGVAEETTVTVSITSTGGCDLSVETTTEACEPANEVATLAELRAGTEGEEYTLTGEAILTFQKTERNQKWLEDDTAGILIDDSPGVITTSYEIGDGITGITGTLSSFNGLLQFRPSVDPGAASSTDNDVEPQIVTIAQLNDDGEAYESELVVIEDATISDAGTAWVDDTNYTLTTGDGEFTLRTTLEDFDTDYIGETIPTSAVNLAGFITQFDNDDSDGLTDGYQITPRFSSDIDFALSVSENSALVLSMYPNPTTGIVTISTALQAEKQVTVYDITGKQVLNTTTTGRLDISALQSGLYLVQISENGVTATARLLKQ